LKNKPLAMLSPLCLCLFAGSAWADLEPFTVGASETVVHDSNISRDDANRISDWYSTTELRAGVNQALGRDQLIGNAAVNYTGYRDQVDHDLDSFGYQGALRLDWSTIGDLSGSLGGDAGRRRYDYGFEDASGALQGRNLETDSHEFAKISLGGLARWNIFAGFDANRRRFSSTTYEVNDEQQWSQSLGTTYSTSPDLSFGITGNYTRGEYPNYVTSSGNFDSKIVSATTKWQASGNSLLNASLGYTQQNSDLQPTLRFVNGSLSWNWSPPSRFSVSLAMSRSTDGGAASGTATSLTDRSLNTTGSLNVSYAMTAKISLVAGGQYIHRKYADVTVPAVLPNGSVDPNPADDVVVSGTNHSTRFSLSAHYQPTRTTDLSCGAAHEVRASGSIAVLQIAPNYTDNTVQCAASINFD
jgi:hypothetical protein